MQIFGRMNRLEELKKYYYQCEKVKILEKHSLLLAELNSSMDTNPTNPIAHVTPRTDNACSSTSEVLVELLKNWLDYSIEIWQKEV